MPEKILTIDNSTFFVTCRMPGEGPRMYKMCSGFPPVDNPGCSLDYKTGRRKMAWLPICSKRNPV